MKTSVIEVHAMLSVWSVDDVEKRIGEVPGVESVTVNYAAGSATVRYDETRLEIADIKSAVRQRGYESATHAAASPSDAHEGRTASGAPPATPTSPAEKLQPAAPAPAPVPAPAPGAAPTAPAGKGHEGHAKAGPQPAMSADMAHEMGHSGKDLPAMVRDMRNRFWICLIFTVPIFVYAPMGGFFKPPAPPFGMKLNLWLFFFASAAILYPSWPFFVSAWRALRKGTLGMAALIVLSVGHRVSLQCRHDILLQGWRAVLRSGRRPSGLHPPRPLAGDACPCGRVLRHQGVDEPHPGEGLCDPQWRRG